MKQSIFWARCFVTLLLVTCAPLTQSASAGTLLLDNLTLWTSNSSFLNTLAANTSSPPGTFVAPQTTFTGATGLQMSGLTGDFTFTGLQSLATFSAPYTATVYVTPIQGTANPFAIYLVSADFTQYLTVHANVNPAYQGFWTNATNISALWQLGEQFSPSFVPQMNTSYKVVLKVDTAGAGTVKIYGGGKLLGKLSNLQPGMGPYYLVIGQRIGLAPTGSQVADWSFVRVTTP